VQADEVDARARVAQPGRADLKGGSKDPTRAPAGRERSGEAGGSNPLLGGVGLALLLVIHADVISSLEGALEGFFQSILSGIDNFFGTIFQSLANTIAAIFNAPVQAIDTSFASLNNWAANYGPLAPIITILVVAAVFLLVVLLIWLIIKISVSEGEQTLGEAEEGA
jgi:hypothetical protein